MSGRLTKISATIAVASASFINAVMLSALNVCLPIIQSEFSIHAVTLTWINTSFVLSNAVFLIAAGKIGDIFGRKRVFLGGMAMFIVTTLLCGISGSAEFLILFRVLQGLGSAMVNATIMAILSSVFPPQKRGMAIGIGTAAIYTGLSFGPFFGGMLSAALGWRWIFFITAPVEILPFLITLICIREEWADAKGEKFDLAGSLIYGVSLVLFMYGITILPKIIALVYLIPGTAGLILFIRRELKISYPVLEIRLFNSNRVFAFSSVAALINYMSTYAITFLLSLFLQFSMGVSPQMTGLILTTQPIAQAALSPIAGKFSDRIDPAILVTTGMGMVTVGLFILSRLTSNTSSFFIVFILFLLGCGYAFFSSPNTNAIMGSVEKRYYGQASGAVATMRSLGMVLSMGITTIIFSVYMGPRGIGAETLDLFNHSFRLSFLIFSILCLVGIYFSAVRGNSKREK